MKSALFMLLLFGVLTSCNQYHYLAVSGENLTKSEKKELVYENDTLRVSYQFTGGENQLSIAIFNKTINPIEVDWQKSAFIFNSVSFSYYQPVKVFNGTLKEDSPGLPSHYNDRSVSGTITANEAVQFIPPGSSVQKTVRNLPLKATHYSTHSSRKKSAYNVNTGEPISFRETSFSEDETPAGFRSFLTYTIKTNDQAFTRSLDHHFYVSAAWKSNAGPSGFSSELAKRGDIYYYKL